MSDKRRGSPLYSRRLWVRSVGSLMGVWFGRKGNTGFNSVDQAGEGVRDFDTGSKNSWGNNSGLKVYERLWLTDRDGHTLSLMSSTILFSGPVLLLLAWPGGAGFFDASPMFKLKLVGLVGLIGPFGV